MFLIIIFSMALISVDSLITNGSWKNNISDNTLITWAQNMEIQLCDVIQMNVSNYTE